MLVLLKTLHIYPISHSPYYMCYPKGGKITYATVVISSSCCDDDNEEKDDDDDDHGYSIPHSLLA